MIRKKTFVINTGLVEFKLKAHFYRVNGFDTYALYNFYEQTVVEEVTKLKLIATVQNPKSGKICVCEETKIVVDT